MLVRGKVIGEKVTAPFEILKTGDGIFLRVELPGEPFEYSTDCSCLEPLEFLGLLLPAIEERIGEIEGCLRGRCGRGKEFPFGTAQENTPRKMRKTFYWLVIQH